MDRRRLLLGDWHPLLRDGIDLLRLVVLAGAVGFAVRGDTGGAAILGVTGAAVLAARVVNLPRLYDLSFVLAMGLQGFGEAFDLYDAISWFDRVVHVLVPMLSAPVVYIALARLDVLPDPRDETHGRHYTGIAIVCAALGLAIGALWEILEFTSDGLLGTSLSLGNEDTVGDLVADAVGAVAGALLLVAWTVFGWGSVRRIPGENLREDVDA